MTDLPIRRKPPEGAAGRREPAPVIQRLRARQQQLSQGSRRSFVLPGYDSGNEALGGELVAYYRRMTFDELEAVFAVDRWTDDAGKYDVVAANAQFLSDACEDLEIHEPDGTRTPLIEGHATTYVINLASGQSLATLLGVDHLPSLRAQMVEAFGKNELALNEHSGVVHRWMVSANSADQEKALGEA